MRRQAIAARLETPGDGAAFALLLDCEWAAPRGRGGSFVQSENLIGAGENALVQILYRSRCQLRGGRAKKSAGIGDILQTARLHNPRFAVTGVLFFDGAYFVQTLEGPPRTIAALYANIQRDPRHGDVTLLSHAPLATRCFDGWAMAYIGGEDEPGFRIPSGYLSEVVADGDDAAGPILAAMQYFLRAK